MQRLLFAETDSQNFVIHGYSKAHYYRDTVWIINYVTAEFYQMNKYLGSHLESMKRFWISKSSSSSGPLWSGG